MPFYNKKVQIIAKPLAIRSSMKIHFINNSEALSKSLGFLSALSYFRSYTSTKGTGLPEERLNHQHFSMVLMSLGHLVLRLEGE